MRTAVLITAVCLSFNVLAQQPASPEAEPPDYLFNLAVFEVADADDAAVPYADFGKVVRLPGEIHRKDNGMRVDTTMVSRMNVKRFAGHLTGAKHAVLVTNVTAKAGDVPRAPCGLGMNIELDFAEAALKSGDTTRLKLRTYAIAEGTESPKAGDTLFASGRDAVEQGVAEFPTVEGETLVVEVVRLNSEGVYLGCIAIVTP